ncbi:hypothetical protein [Pseudomonas mediterranea]|uniref:hypothetical protein n=1 Tax=Pseudomonas mediterranea TaxID=183795 RepID=UPI0006D8B8AC|nr:hypothetical protein [Pseudomonas mediterranea]
MAKAKTPATEQEKTQTTAAPTEQAVDKSEPGVADPATTGTADPLTTPAPDSTSEKTAEPSAEMEVLQPIIDSMDANTNSDARAKIDAALGGIGETPAPTMVNGRYVGDKKFNQETGEWEADPDKVQAVRPEDIFDRIGNAFPHEAQRLVIEELARAVGLTADGTVDLPDGMPTRGKSTASLRTDLTGHGAYAGGKSQEGPAPVPVGTDGKAQVDVDLDDGK